MPEPHHFGLSERIDGALIGLGLALAAIAASTITRVARMMGGVVALAARYTLRRWLRSRGVPDDEIDEALNAE